MPASTPATPLPQLAASDSSEELTFSARTWTVRGAALRAPARRGAKHLLLPTWARLVKFWVGGIMVAKLFAIKEKECGLRCTCCWSD